MTENEAIKELKEDYNELGKAIPCDTGWGVAINEAYSIAIKALEEIQEYRAIGTVEEFKALKDINRIADNLSKMERIEFKALKEKNEPKKPYIQQIVKDFREHDCYECPNCDCFVGYVSECQEEHYQDIYCPNCGQKLDWQ